VKPFAAARWRTDPDVGVQYAAIAATPKAIEPTRFAVAIPTRDRAADEGNATSFHH
jgi:hypothetical protein